MLEIPNSRVALLIDADNAQLSCLEFIIKCARNYGDLKIARAYGDWKQRPLSAFFADVRDHKIKAVQVNRIGKDDTDKQILIEATEILTEREAEIFVIVSGDGDFRQLCERIKQKNCKIVGIGNKGQTSPHLKESCDIFHFVEDLEKALVQPEPSRPSETFESLLLRALKSMPHDKDGWVLSSALGTKLRELDPHFESHFGSKKLSERLKGLSDQIEVNERSIRVIDSENSKRVDLLRKACLQVQSADGKAHIGQIGQALRTLDPKFDSRFGKKKLSTWFKEYSHIFKQHDNYVSLL